MNENTRSNVKAAFVLLPVAAIIIGLIGDIDLLRTIGMWSLAAYIFLAVLDGRIHRVRQAVSPWSVVLALGVAVVIFIAAFLPNTSLDFMLIPVLVGCLAALVFIIGRIVYGLVRV